jgi:hypothetical protein
MRGLLGCLLALGCSDGAEIESSGEVRQGLDELLMAADLEQASINNVNPDDPRLLDNGFNFPLEPEGSNELPYISPSLAYRNARSLQMTLRPRPASSHGPDRSELSLYHMSFESRYGIKFRYGFPKYMGFAMYVHGSSDFPLASVVHFMQAWQVGAGETCGVPFHATLQRGSGGSAGPLSFYMVAHHDAYGGSGRHEVVPPTPMSVNAWHTFVFRLEPRSMDMGGAGAITVWYDGLRIADVGLPWGCNVTSWSSDNADGFVHDSWMLRAGLYRTDDVPIDQDLHVFFDNLKLASSYGFARP